MKQYQDIIKELSAAAEKLSRKDRQISVLRLLCLVSAVILISQYFRNTQLIWLICGGLAIVAFGLVIKYHSSVRWLLQFYREKIRINEEELSFLNGDLSALDAGKEFIKHDHPYSFDLDFFGEHSLYHSLNRTATFSGKNKLASTLLQIASNEEILARQDALKELTPKLEWRQTFTSLARMYPDSKESFGELMEWSMQPALRINRFLKTLMYALPTAMLTSFVLYLFTSSSLFGNLSGLLFLINLAILGSFTKTIKKELVDTTKIEKILKQYAFLLKEIEHHTFETKELQELQRLLDNNGQNASVAIHQLATLFGRMEHVANVFASPLLNGALLYHVHVLLQLSSWRRKHSYDIKNWLEVIGEMETRLSLANFCFNNAEYTFPSLNQSFDIRFEDLGHPLIAKEKSVTNSVDFRANRFFILTGSNMSGKSTFLRTVGVNMVLAGIGAPVVATKADVHPLPIHVSMRLSDSLTDSESYFYAEVKRLKSIMDQLDQGPCFVLLDEILRGTNSDDKRNGTIEVIRKMALKEAYGGIATHDLEVCKTTDEFPTTLVNKRFEVEIINDELVFDYRLKEGICENKSASFIMQKMGVI